MPAITLKNIPSNLYDSLKESAKNHHRSINGEAIACLERSVGVFKIDPQETIDRIINLRSRVKLPSLTDRILKEAKAEGRI